MRESRFRRTLLPLATIGALVVAGLSAADDREAANERPRVLLELFTSEGCSSCPPADRLLEELAAGTLAPGVEVIPLSMHVDYWNHLGWRDPYSNALFSRRQESYGGVLSSDVYTPQLVIDGQTQLVGSDRRAALAAIARSAKQPRAAVSLERLTAATTSPRQASWRVAIDASALTQRPPATHLFVAITEDGLASSVARGENAGRTLRHVAVVRSLRTLGRVWLDQAGRATQDFTIELETSWQPERLQVVAWVADGPAGHVLGARRAAL